MHKFHVKEKEIKVKQECIKSSSPTIKRIDLNNECLLEKTKTTKEKKEIWRTEKANLGVSFLETTTHIWD